MKHTILVQIPRDQIGSFLSTDMVQKLESMGDVIWNPYDRSFTKEELKSRIADVHTVITTWGSTPISADVVEFAPRLKLIAHCAGSIKPILDPVVYENGVTVLNSNYAIAVSVAESVIALILAIGHNIVQVSNEMKAGKWTKHFTFELRERRVGLVGLGLVARELIKLLRPFDCSIIAYDPYVSRERAEELGVELVTFENLIKHSEILSLHAPSVPETFHMFGERELSMIPDGTILINTARGSLIDEPALVTELRSGRFFAGLDVFENEPLSAESELRTLENVLVRPHLAGVTPRSKLRIGSLMVEDIERFYNNKVPLYEVKVEQLSNMT